MADFTIRKGNRLPGIEAVLYDGNGVVDLTDAVSVELRVRPEKGETATVVYTAEITGLTTGRVRYLWGVGTTDTPGIYNAAWRVTWPSSKTSDYPNKGTLKIAITDDL
ncbi:MAG TPA: hypothetical protein VJ396_01080 [Acidiferrobacterales bacterium]|nr:hypothetical protein [Acidiferrobacterales bacterium]